MITDVMLELIRLYRRDKVVPFNPYGGWVSGLQQVGDSVLATFTRAIDVPPLFERLSEFSHKELIEHPGQISATVRFDSKSQMSDLRKALEVCAPGLLAFVREGEEG